MPTSEQLEIRSMARDFAAGELRPHSAAWDAARELPGDLFQRMAEMGFLGMRIPEEHGGLELDLTTYLLALEALAWGDGSTALGVQVHNGPVVDALLLRGSAEQKARWLPELASGERLGAYSLSEPEAGSDAAAISCTATREGDDWVLTGEKRWVTNGGRAGLLVVFARTAGSPGDKDGISAFLVRRETPGIEMTGREVTLGMCASETARLTLHGVRVGAEALLGAEGEGYGLAMDTLVIGRMGVAAQALGIAQAAFEHALRYATEREQFGSALGRFGGIQEKLAGMAVRVNSARALLLDGAKRLNGAERGGLDLPASSRSVSAMCKVAASEAAMWVSDEAVQIFGGYGYMRDYPVEQLMRDAKGTEIYEGSNEVLRMVIAMDALRESQA